MDIQSLSTEKVIDIQKSTLPNSGKPDINKLEGALFRVQTLKDHEGSEDVFKFTAMYLIAIAKAYTFNDANKQTAFQATGIFLILNGFELNASFELVKLTILATIGEADGDNTAFALKVLSNYRNDLLEGTITNDGS
ncbi:type II toxin-antitoxin system death-on-curing family toxin [Xenorhabdus sp. IM139775]|uniref:type II toxin-antitoxin system death-on-curing family toxin n=1 Tax=Xenorhabdus sp. IM139775 TaxID=3025876 RepID=UPI0023581F24|nr:type II toxin-antitoxin system death-on-curing family toxin [Xenorhabdus sp. IM139775]MDC9592702.1 type II toxin-antitoxin system death-on-curing family toxin [Xenorhabdus sp. IM139775]